MTDQVEVVSLAASTGINAVQRLSFSAPPAGGNLVLSLNGVQTANISGKSFSAAKIQSGLEGLSNVGVGNVVVALSGTTDYDITFQNAMGWRNVNTLVVASNTLSPSGMTITINTTTVGSPPSVSEVLGGGGALGAVARGRVPVVMFLGGGGSPQALVAGRVPFTTALASGGALTALAAGRVSFAKALSGDGALTASTMKSSVRALTFAGDGGLSVLAVGVVSFDTAFSGDGALTATGAPSFDTASTGDGELSAVVMGVVPVIPRNTTGNGVLSASVMKVVPVDAVLSGDGELTALSMKSSVRATTLTGDGELAASWIRQGEWGPHLTGDGQLSARCDEHEFVSQNLKGTGSLRFSIGSISMQPRPGDPHYSKLGAMLTAKQGAYAQAHVELLDTQLATIAARQGSMDVHPPVPPEKRPI